MPDSMSHDPVDEMARFLATAPSRDAIARFALSEASRAHALELLQAASAGHATADQEAELDRITLLGDFMSLVRLVASEGQPTDEAATVGDEYARFFACGPSRDEIVRFSPTTTHQRRLAQLHARMRAGEATPDEQAEWHLEAALDAFCAQVRQLAGQGISASDHPSGISATPGR